MRQASHCEERIMRIVPVVFLLFMLVGSAAAQSSAPDTRTNRRTNRDEVEYILVRLEPRVLAIAEAMPASKYSFAPTNGEFKGVRTFAEQLKHIAADNYLDGAAIAGEQPPGNVGSHESGSSAVQGKDAIIAYVRDSFEYLRQAVRRKLDDDNLSLPNPAFLPYGPTMTTRMHIALANLGHTNDHYGQLIEYLRMNGIVPPENAPKSGP